MNSHYRCFLLAVMTALVGGAATFAADASLDINVRTTVEIPKDKSLGPHPTFVMVRAVEVASGEKLVRPVPENTMLGMLQLLQEKLQAQGYVGVTDKTRPEILITLQYGRGYLPNPYTQGMTTADVGATAGSVKATGTMGGETGRSVVVRGPTDFMRRSASNYESKMQAANQEKLFLTIAAWNFASMQKGAKPVRYWTTTVLVDDPDHLDLNGIYPQMLAAGAEFFNRRLDKEEVEVTTRVREGHVEVGTPTVVDESKAKK